LNLKNLYFAILATMALNVNAATIYSSTFTDNGNKVTEVRTFADSSVQIWEWLDLTVTNGISYNSLIADLADDDKLNNSIVLTANLGAIDDVEGLSSDDQSGWQTQSDLDIVDLFNNFFTLSLVEGDTHHYNANVSIVEEFIVMFGDTFHEGLVEYGGPGGTNGVGRNSGYTLGMTSTTHPPPVTDENVAAIVHDGQYFNRIDDQFADYIYLTRHVNPDEVVYAYGSWLARLQPVVSDAQPVNAPTTIVLFALALMGIGVRRRLM
jgi:hypothetical protein